MPTLPSGRRIEFSLDRFHALLEHTDRHFALTVAENLNDPDDLLFVLDAVHFCLETGKPYFAEYVAADWISYAADWSTADRKTLQAWLVSSEVRSAHAEAIDYIKGLWLDQHAGNVAYPYLIQNDICMTGMMEGPRLLQ
jgi:hypothetical protein